MNITAIVGRNGSGKTRYVDALRKQLASDSVRYVAFRDSYGPAVDGSYYLQLRWNQHDIDHEMPSAADVLDKAFQQTGPDTPERRAWRDHLCQLFNLDHVMDKYIITLSSGELRKFQLVRALLSRPRTLILDEPFIGLDAPTRQQLRDLLFTLATDNDLHLYLVLARRDDVPDYVEKKIHPQETDLQQTAPQPLPVMEGGNNSLPLNVSAPLHHKEGLPVIRMNHVTIRYGERTILRDLNWTVMSGERWALSGRNGSGKSTLLSLVCADNPQAYACDIQLFGHQRGESGVSIWDIKRRIGYVSPELARSYRHNQSVLHVVASGLKDTVGLYVRPNEREAELCRLWLHVFGIGHLEQRSFLNLSSGEQRLVLVARAFVKDPELLILDEPLHGLDDENRQLVRRVIMDFCSRPNKTLIMVTHYEEELPPCIDRRLRL
ncbi:MAG: ATP-binding cassette domain-containing protein [Prevotella sp.]|nr:ATP-binding cassette domain-containing protein [Prevotella sp.]